MILFFLLFYQAYLPHILVKNFFEQVALLFQRGDLVHRDPGSSAFYYYRIPANRAPGHFDPRHMHPVEGVGDPEDRGIHENYIFLLRA